VIGMSIQRVRNAMEVQKTVMHVMAAVPSSTRDIIPRGTRYNHGRTVVDL
jgi:hypothetical protein